MSGDEGLRALAEAATPGPWEVYRTTNSIHVSEIDERGFATFGLNAIADAAFIAAANPTAVLALLDRLAAAEAALERCRALVVEFDDDMSDYGGYYARDLQAALDNQATT